MSRPPDVASMLSRTVVTCIGLLAAVLVGSGAAPGYEAVTVEGGGAVTGTVKLSGAGPAPERIPVTRDQQSCGSEPKVSEALVVSSGGGIKNVVASLEGVARGKAFPDSPVELDQRGCWFHPHVVLVPAGKPFTLLNNDGVLHNFRTPGGGENPALNKAQPRFKKRLPITIEHPDIIHANCDVHEWMRAVIVVMAHPYYAVSDEHGAFSLRDIPPGRYRLTLWHETLGKQTRDVVVSAGAEAKIAVEFAGR